MKMMKFLLVYLDQDEEEQVEELYAYSEQQALYLAQDFCDVNKMLSLECTVRAALL